MTRAEILKMYDVDSRGIIRSPGQFEGEKIYLPAFWDVFLSGFFDFERGPVMGWYITPEDRAEFPEISKRKRTVKLVQRNDGFIVEV